MHGSSTGWWVMGVVVMTVGGTVFRVATAPDRVRDRQETARRVCAERGGQWVMVDKRDVCRLPETTAVGL